MSLSAERIDPRVRRTRELLVKAFAELLGEKSFDDITINDVTERATVNRATFYAHFRDKYAILNQTMYAWFMTQLQSKLPEDAGLDPKGVRSLVLAVCGFLTDVSGRCRRVEGQFEPLAETQTKKVLGEILLGWLRERAGADAPVSGKGAGHGKASGDGRGTGYAKRSTGGKGRSDGAEAALEMRATVASWAIYGAVLQWSRAKDRAAAEAFADDLLPLVLAGLEG